MRAAYMAAAVTVLAVAWWYTQDEASEELGEVIEDTAQALDEWTGGIMKLSDMAKVTMGHVRNPNMQAFLRVIRRGEGTSDAGGYTRLFGGEQFASLADHPRRKVVKGGYTSTAAGAYQALMTTWDETRAIMKLADFSPTSQDLFAVGRIAARGALNDVLAGRLEAAIKKCAREWASLPYSPYGQPVISMATASGVFTNSGGVIA